jgi:hypothetical protein
MIPEFGEESSLSGGEFSDEWWNPAEKCHEMISFYFSVFHDGKAIVFS